MAMEPWQPFREMQTFREMMDGFFQGAFGTQGSFPVDVAENEQGYSVRASLPGIKPADIDVRVEGNVLTIRGETKSDQEQPGQDQRWLRREHRASSFYRSLTLPAAINAEQVQATYENGVLQLTLPKAAAAKAKQITINAANQAQPATVLPNQQPKDDVMAASMDSFPASDPPSTSESVSTPSDG